VACSLSVRNRGSAFTRCNHVCFLPRHFVGTMPGSDRHVEAMRSSQQLEDLHVQVHHLSKMRDRPLAHFRGAGPVRSASQ